jgi:hypothetical protein
MWRSPATSFVGYRAPGNTDRLFWVRAELDDRMGLNNWSIAGSYDIARIAVSYEFAGSGFGSSTPSRSIISRPRRTGLSSGSAQV